MGEPLRRGSVSQHFSQSYLGKWVIVGLAIGTIAGFGATAFYFMIQLVSNMMLGGLTGFYLPNPAGELPVPQSIHPNYLLIPVVTMLGGLISGFLVYRFAPEAEGHGTDAAIDAFHNKGGVIRKRVPLIKIVASAFTIGSGGSAGREGPTAQIAAGFGSIVSDILRLPVRDRRIAVAVGIGAGIGAIFKSPFGGAILSAEILYSGGDMEGEALIPAFIASPVGYAILASFTGFTPVFGYTVHYTFTHPLDLVAYAILGLVCAGAGRLYSYTFYSVRALFERLRVSNYAKPVIGGAAVGIVGYFFPEVLGMGYGFLQPVIEGNVSSTVTNFVTLPLLVTLVLLILFKILVTSATVGSGGSGGVFAPALFVGGYVGAALWIVLNAVFPGEFPSSSPLVIIGMMALFAGVGRVPIAVVLMVSEMTGTLALLAPSMVAVVVAYYFTGSKYTIYRKQVATRVESPAHIGEYSVPLLTRLKVKDAMEARVITVAPTDSVESAHQAMLRAGVKAIPVVEGRSLVGIVAVGDVLKVAGGKSAETAVEGVMTRNVVVCYPEETLLDAMRKMTTNDIGRLPVVSPDTGELLGIMTRTDLFRVYSGVVSASKE